MRNMNIGTPTGCELERSPFVAVEETGVDGHILIDGERSFAAVARSDQGQPAASLFGREMLLLVTWPPAGEFRHDPDLQKVHFFLVGGIELAMHDAAPRA